MIHLQDQHLELMGYHEQRMGVINRVLAVVIHAAAADPVVTTLLGLAELLSRTLGEPPQELHQIRQALNLLRVVERAAADADPDFRHAVEARFEAEGARLEEQVRDEEAEDEERSVVLSEVDEEEEELPEQLEVRGMVVVDDQDQLLLGQGVASIGRSHRRYGRLSPTMERALERVRLSGLAELMDEETESEEEDEEDEQGYMNLPQ
jgi:hypothetical protein